MREFLVTKFVCSKCGSNLQLDYNAPKPAGKYAEGEPTGALMVQILVTIEPCACISNQLDEARKAVKTLLTF